jgi:benzaldehyde dehydrogenase (NAD)
LGKRLPRPARRATLALFGGVGQSGPGGQSGGDANIEEFTERRWLTVTPGPAHYPY